jgi:hypothetical protein
MFLIHALKRLSYTIANAMNFLKMVADTKNVDEAVQWLEIKFILTIYF